MGFFDKMAGRPQVPRRQSGRQEERAAERQAMRASRESGFSQTSQTGSHRHHGGYGLFGKQQSSGGGGRGERSPSRPSTGHPGSYGQQGSGSYGARPSSPREKEVGFYDKFKQVLSFAPGRDPSPAGPASRGGRSASPHQAPAPARQQQDYYPPPGHQGGARERDAPREASRDAPSSQQVRDLQHKVSVLESQLQELDEARRRAVAGERTALDWKEKWNYQNFKLNLMVDMLVLKTMESDPGSKVAAGSLVGSLARHAGQAGPSNAGSGPVGIQSSGVVGGGLQGVGRAAASHRDSDLIEEDVEEM